MKLTSVEIHSPNFPTIIVLSFRDPLRTGQYNIKSFTGLDADEIISKFSGTAANSATIFNNLFQKKREVTAKISLNPEFDLNQSYSDLRDTLYKMISSSRTGRVELHFKNHDDTLAVLYGYISKFESQQTESVPEVQLTIKCDEPFLIDPVPVIVPVAGLSFANFTITDDKSTAPHGFKFQMHFTNNVNAIITISDPNDPSWFFKFSPPLVWLPGDILQFSSYTDERYLMALRASGGAPAHMADGIWAGSSWPMIFPGINRFKFDYTANMAWDNMSYSHYYWGV